MDKLSPYKNHENIVYFANGVDTVENSSAKKSRPKSSYEKCQISSKLLLNQIKLYESIKN